MIKIQTTQQNNKSAFFAFAEFRSFRTSQILQRTLNYLSLLSVDKLQQQAIETRIRTIIFPLFLLRL
jgi:hypothetical protein